MISNKGIEYLETYLNELAKEGAFPGECFGIVTHDGSYFGHAGYAQIRPYVRKMREDSIFDIASLTKVVATTTSIMILIEMGEIRLDEKIRNILPQYKHNDTTVLQLLTHTSGLPADVKFYKICNDPAEIIDKLYNTDLEYKPGELVLYSDLNYMLLGLIIKRIAEPVDKFSKKYVFNPLGMSDTSFTLPKEKLDRCVATEYKEGRGIIVGQVHDGNAYALGGISGHAGLFSTAHDLGRFAAMILNDGCYRGSMILSEASVKLISSCYTDKLNESRGLGWRIKRAGDKIGDAVYIGSLYHTGFTGTSILIDRTAGLGFVLLTNRIHPSRNNESLLGLRSHINDLAEQTVK